eukprot:gene7323-443_t
MRDPGALPMLLCLVFSSFALQSLAQLSTSATRDEHLEQEDKKFLQRKAELDHAPPAPFSLHSNHCHQHDGQHNIVLDTKWMTEVSSSIYATPLITDLYSDGRKDIIVPSFVHYLEALEGADGAQSVGWPAFHKSTVHASPMMYDIDFDGIRDVMVITFDAEVIFFKDTDVIIVYLNGELIFFKDMDVMVVNLNREVIFCKVTRLKIRRDWFVGLDPDPIDHSSPDISDTGKDHIGGYRERQPPATRAVGSGSGSDAGSVGGGGGAAGGGHRTNLTQEVQQQVLEYKEKLKSYRSKFGDTAMKKMLEETKGRNPGFYKIVLADMERVDAELHAKLLEETKAKNPGFYKIVLADMERVDAELHAVIISDPSPSPVPNPVADPVASPVADPVASPVSDPIASPVADPVEASESFEVFNEDYHGDEKDVEEREHERDYQNHHDLDYKNGHGEDDDEGGADEDEADLSAEFGDNGDEEDYKLAAERKQPTLPSISRGPTTVPPEAAAKPSIRSSIKTDRARTHRSVASQALHQDRRSPDGRPHTKAVLVDELYEEGIFDDYRHSLHQEFEYDEFGDRFVSSLGGDFRGDEEELQGDTLDLLDLSPMLTTSVMDRRGADRYEDEAFEQSPHPRSLLLAPLPMLSNCTRTSLLRDALPRYGAIGDIDGDGHEELVLAVSFFYDPEYYDDPEHERNDWDLHYHYIAQ